MRCCHNSGKVGKTNSERRMASPSQKLKIGQHYLRKEGRNNDHKRRKVGDIISEKKEGTMITEGEKLATLSQKRRKNNSHKR
jgi:hypothetical protein